MHVYILLLYYLGTMPIFGVFLSYAHALVDPVVKSIVRCNLDFRDPVTAVQMLDGHARTLAHNSWILVGLQIAEVHPLRRWRDSHGQWLQGIQSHLWQLPIPMEFQEQRAVSFLDGGGSGFPDQDITRHTDTQCEMNSAQNCGYETWVLATDGQDRGR